MRLMENTVGGVSEVNVLRNALKNNGQTSTKSSRNTFTASTTFRAGSN